MAAQFLSPLEILDCAFVFFRRRLAVERAEISSFPCLRIFLAWIQPIFAGFQLPYHGYSSARCTYPNLTPVAPPNIRSALQTRARWIVGQPRRFESRLADGVPPYKGFLKRFEKPSARSAARIARFVARWDGKLQCWLAWQKQPQVMSSPRTFAAIVVSVNTTISAVKIDNAPR